MGKDVIIALDFPTSEESLDFLKQFKEEKPFVKVGIELFYSEGKEIIYKLLDSGHRIFLDIKLHDIPNTVYRTARKLSDLNVEMINCHVAGTVEMMKAVVTGLKDGNSNNSTKVLGVTQLTSTLESSLKNELLVSTNMEETVRFYAKNAKLSGLDGVICSPLETMMIKEECGLDFLAITPGIRYNEESDDQKRVTNPIMAKQLMSDYIVVGRPITQAKDPVFMYKQICKEFIG